MKESARTECPHPTFFFSKTLAPTNTKYKCESISSLSTVKPNNSCIAFRPSTNLHRTSAAAPPPPTALTNMSLPHTEFLLPPATLHRRAVPSRHHHRPWKRRRLKLRNDFNPTPGGNLFHTLISQFHSLNSLNYIAPTLGFASGLALFFSANPRKLLQNPNNGDDSRSDIGEWILFSSPTPFNRFVTLRCPSIYFPENELLENVSEKLVKEERHYVKLNSGRMIQPVESNDGVDENMVYQRLCIVTDDGGVLSLDWPANLELEEERGFDTTVLIVPGTSEGSHEWKIRAFVCDCLKRGVFPVVMNPRGCAGSPLTTPRLFTAADSDDISTAVQYITKKRPWTTLMAVGWEYGANMLTKYLAECGQRTPLTAATCIDNPFDLEESMRSSGYHTNFNQRHTDGLINILQSNKELFQGRGKGFDVEKALSASSIRDFEKAISMVSYGINTIDEFYAKSSTRDVVGKVEVPLLFIQNDDGKVPFFSIPRSLIAENPYTSLLLCSYKPSSKIMDDNSAFSWCQHLTLEWLTAVELGLLKGRHPLLEDVDVTINPSKNLALVERRDSSKSGRVDKLLNHTNRSPTNTQLEMFQANDTAKSIQSRPTKDMGQPPPMTEELQQEDSNVGIESNATINEGSNSLDSENGQAQQTAQVVLNMLDVTMPDALSDEKKKKVLNAVGQGETLINALQDAVPEDVRGKLTTAVSGILESRKTDLKFDKLLSLGNTPDVASGLNSKVQEKNSPTKDNRDKDVQPLDQTGSSKVEHNSDKSPGDTELEKQSSEISQEQNVKGIVQSTNNHGSDSPESGNGDLIDTGNSHENEKSSGGDKEIVSEINDNQDMSNGPDVAKDVSVQKKVEGGADNSQSDSVDENNKQKNEFPSDQDKISEADKTGENTSASSSASESQVIEREAENDQKKEEKGPMPVISQNTSDPPSFSVSQALYALTGFDDSTQVAVNSVFHVIEDMIDNLEVEKDKVDDMKEENNEKEKDKVDEKNEKEKDNVDEMKHDNNEEKEKEKVDEMKDENNEEKEGSISKNHQTENNPKSESKISSVPAAEEIQTKNLVNSLYRSSGKVPNYVATLPYGDPLYMEYLKTLKMKSAKPLDMDKTSALYLDYIPEEGRWKLLEQTEDDVVTVNEESQTDSQPRSENSDNIIEPSYVILDHSEEIKKDAANDNVGLNEAKFGDPMLLIKSLILECLNVEVGRRASGLNMEDLKKLSEETKYVANAVSVAAGKGMQHRHNVNDTGNFGILDGENIIRAISSSIQNTQCLRTVLPIGIVVGSCLASLREFFDVAAVNGGEEQTSALDQDYKKIAGPLQVGEKEITQKLVTKIEDKDKLVDSVDEKEGENKDKLANSIDEKEGENRDKLASSIDEKEGEYKDKLSSSIDEKEGDIDLGIPMNNEVMIGAVTAALGASALLTNQQNFETPGASNEPLKEKNNKESGKLDEVSDKTHHNIVTSLAEKAFSVASPVMPVKEDGEVDHERLVAMFTELGQRGGMLRLVGKIALLWGGIRGAMSLADKLMSFLRIAERPLFQRIPGFVLMVFLLWSPVVLPLLPTLMQSWAMHNPSKIVEFACIVGLYVSIIIMITLWGKRVHKYDDPLLQYGFDLDSISKLQNFLKGLVGGTILVILIHAVNSTLGCANLCWPTNLLSSSLEPIALMKSYGRLLLQITQGVVTATGIAVVEELFFRSWLPQEIATDFGYHRGVFISGLLFALSQRSIWEVPGLWMLSLSLSGARQRSGGSLSLPIGLRAGILASSFILKTGGFLKYQINFPLWVTGAHPFQPFSGVVGLAFSLVLAAIFYPRPPLYKNTTTKVIRG